MSRIYRSPLINVALDPTSAHVAPYVGRLLTALRRPGYKAWLVPSLRSRENADHQESTSNRVSKPPGVRTNEDSTKVVWTNVVTLCWLPRLEWLTSLIHASKVP
jgi:hypothetical protein